jgi:hypothetical protein
MNPYDFYITPEEYAAAAARGISARTLTWRIREACWPKDKALTTPQRQVQDRSHWMEVARKNGIAPKTVRNRVHVLGWSWERAVTEPPRTEEQARRMMRDHNPVRRKYPPEMLALARKNGIKDDTFRFRITKLKWSPERAATTPVMSSQEKGQLAIRALREKRGNINGPIFKRV